MTLGGVNLLHYIHYLADTQHSRHHDHKTCHQTNQRLILEFKLCDLEICVKVIAGIVKARSIRTAYVTLTMYMYL